MKKDELGKIMTPLGDVEIRKLKSSNPALF